MWQTPECGKRGSVTNAGVWKTRERDKCGKSRKIQKSPHFFRNTHMQDKTIVDLMDSLLGMHPDELSNSLQSLEWSHFNVSSKTAHIYKHCKNIAHALHIFLSALACKDFPVDGGLCMEMFLRSYIYEHWNMPHYFDTTESVTWGKLINTLKSQKMSNTEFLQSISVNHELFVMAFVEFMTRIYMPAFVRLHFDDGRVLEIDTEDTTEEDHGPHFTIDIVWTETECKLLKTNSMHKFQCFGAK